MFLNFNLTMPGDRDPISFHYVQVEENGKTVSKCRHCDHLNLKDIYLIIKQLVCRLVFAFFFFKNAKLLAMA